MRRRSLLAGGLGAAAAAAVRRRRRSRRTVELGYADGSALSLEEGTRAADDLIALTRRALRQAGGA